MDLRAARRAFSTYRTTSTSTQAFVLARYVVAPLGPLADEFGDLQGRVLSLGSGLSMVERYLAELAPGLHFDGIDLDQAKIEIIDATRERSPRVSLGLGDATQIDAHEAYDVVLVCDAMHHFPAERHAAVARQVAGALRPGGIAIVKDLDILPVWKHEWNRVHDRIVAGPEPIACRTVSDMARLLLDAGLTVERADRIDHRLSPYAHYLVRARKPG